MGIGLETPNFFNGQEPYCPDALFSFTDLEDLRKLHSEMYQEVGAFNQTNPVGFVTHLYLDNYVGSILEAVHPAVNGHESTRKIRVPWWYESEEVLIKVAAINPDDEDGQVLQRFALKLADDFGLYFFPQPNRYDGPFNPAFVFRPNSHKGVA